jgi:cob(I)alamin adenosyltransferase
MNTDADPAVVAGLGQVQLYTGDGKGKTSICLGIALRAAGHRLKTYIGQFTKGHPTGEIAAISRYLSPVVTIEQYGRERFIMIDGPPEEQDYALAQRGLHRIRKAIHSGDYNIVICDEINVAVAFGLIMSYQVVDLINTRPPCVELVLSGRYAHPAVIAAAGLVMEVTPVKHYFEQGVMARKGIEL